MFDRKSQGDATLSAIAVREDQRGSGVVEGASEQRGRARGETERVEGSVVMGVALWSGVSIVNQYPDGCRRFERAPYFSMPIHTGTILHRCWIAEYNA